MKKKLNISPALFKAATKAIAAKKKEDAFLETLTPKQKKKYIEQWAHRLAADLAKFND